MIRYFFLFLLLYCLLNLNAQQTYKIADEVRIGDTTQLHQLTLLDSSIFVGYCLAINKKAIRFRFRRAKGITIIPTRKMSALDIYFDPDESFSLFDRPRERPLVNPAFFNPTYHRSALPWGGRAQFRSVNAGYSIVEFNLGDNLQMGAGTILMLGLLTTQTLRFSLDRDLNFGLSHQSLYQLFGVSTGENRLVGDLNANLTLGNSSGWLNLGAGFVYSSINPQRVAHFNLSLGRRLNRKWHLYAEASVLEDVDRVRFFPALSAAYTKYLHRWRFGLFNILSPATPGREGDSILVPIPLIGYEVHW